MNKDKIRSHIERVLKEESEAISNKAKNIDDSLIHAIEVIFNSNNNSRVVVTGVGKSGFIARKFAATLSSIGTKAIFLNPLDALHGDLGSVHEEDIIFGISQSGGSEELLKIFKCLRNNYKVSLTGSQNNKLAQLADQNILNTIKKEACELNLAPTTSTTLALAITDSIAITLMSLKKFTKTDFSKSHPLGTLGKKLTLTIKEIMVSGENLPTTNYITPLKDVIGEISHYGMGFIILEEENLVKGIFTDGDLRRLISDSEFSKYLNDPIHKFCNESFFKIHANELVINALEVMRKNKINSLPVLEGEKIVGAINTRIVINSGII